jgi:hypothetical protein
MPEIDSPATESAEPEFEPVTLSSQAEIDSFVGSRVKKATAKYADYQQLQAKAKRLAELEQANLTESERQTERIRALEDQLRDRDTAMLRHDVATAKGVPAERITGSTREELEQSADELLTFISEWAKTKTPAKTPRPVGSSGASNTENRLDPKERAAAAMRQYYSST